MEAKAVAKTIRVSPQKARLVVDLVRGKTVKEALGILEVSNYELLHYYHYMLKQSSLMKVQF